jgi:amino acid transporter
MFRKNLNVPADKGRADGHPRDSSADHYDDEATNSHFRSTHGSHHDVSDTSLMDPESGVKRGLKNRHLSMMALAGIIGPGLLVGAGGALNSGGPASLIIGFGVIGTCSSFTCTPIWQSGTVQ